MNEYLATKPLDLYQLHLIRLVVETGSFTRSAKLVGLTQSAITRQIQGIENQLGVALFHRTTRQVTPTPAGTFLLKESSHILGDIDQILRRIREDYAEAPKEVRMGVSRTISLSYLPGFFFANMRQQSLCISRVSHDSSSSILDALERDQLDVGVVCPPQRLSVRLQATHRFQDTFTLVANRDRLDNDKVSPSESKSLGPWLHAQPWLQIDEKTETGKRLRSWMSGQKLQTKPTMELDNFDLIINLVALGLGVSIVPQRALALYAKKRVLQRIPWPSRFTRELVVLTRKQKELAPHLALFIKNILF